MSMVFGARGGIKLTRAGRFEYLWQDSENFKRPTKMSAPEYIEHLMSWVQSNIDNEHMFPSKLGMRGTALLFICVVC